VDPTRRIIDFQMGGSIILLHFDEDTGAADTQDGLPPFGWIRHTDGLFVDSSSNDHQVGRTARVDPPYDYENPKIAGGGKFGKCVEASNGGEIYWPHHETMNLRGGDFTSSLWFKADQLGDWYWNDKGMAFAVTLRYPFAPANYSIELRFGLADPTITNPGSGYGWGEYPPGTVPYLYIYLKLQHGLLDPYYAEIKGTSTVAAGVWHHLAMVRKGAFLYLYFNGALEASYEVGPAFWLESEVLPAPAVWERDFHTIYLTTSWDDFIHFDEFNIQKGVLFDGPFTPPTGPYAL